MANFFPQNFAPPSAARKGGFTLVEVTLAVGIAAFAVLSMLGVMAVGMTTMKSAVNDTVHTQITREVVGDLRQANFTQLTNASTVSTWQWDFDNRGLPLDRNNQNKIYAATVAVNPAQLSGGAQNPNLLLVNVTIRNLTEPEHPHVVSTFIANNGQ